MNATQTGSEQFENVTPTQATMPATDVTDANRCAGCANAGETTLGVVVVEIEDGGNGWQTHHYCTSCASALGYSQGDEISLDDQRGGGDPV